MKTKNRKTLTRVFFVNTLAGLQTCFFLFFYVIPHFQGKMVESKKEKLQAVTESVFNVMTEYDRRVAAGELPLKDAQRQAAEMLGALRYGAEGYFGVHTVDSIIIANAASPELVGKDFSSYTDGSGTHVTQEIIKIARENGSGFFEYLWPHAGSTVPVKKITYGKLFSPWGWVIGTGVYIDDIYQETAAFRTRMMIELLLAFTLSSLFTWIWW